MPVPALSIVEHNVLVDSKPLATFLKERPGQATAQTNDKYVVWKPVCNQQDEVQRPVVQHQSADLTHLWHTLVLLVTRIGPSAW